MSTLVDREKMLVEFFDNKFSVFLAVIQPVVAMVL